MAKVTYTASLGTQGFVGDDFSGDLDLLTHSKKSAVFEDESGARVTIKGTGLEFEGSELIAGTVTSLLVKNDAGKLVGTFEKGTWTAETINSALDVIGNQLSFENLVLAGNDRIHGSKKGDYLDGSDGNDRLFGLVGNDRFDGGAGNDVMTGGKGVDIFLFEAGFGADTITDFDALGGGQKQDYLIFGESLGEFEARQEGKNLVIDFGNGDELTLKNVKDNQFDFIDYSPFG